MDVDQKEQGSGASEMTGNPEYAPEDRLKTAGRPDIKVSYRH